MDTRSGKASGYHPTLDAFPRPGMRVVPGLGGGKVRPLIVQLGASVNLLLLCPAQQPGASPGLEPGWDGVGSSKAVSQTES